jgi:hypothetical protein
LKVPQNDSDNNPESAPDLEKKPTDASTVDKELMKDGNFKNVEIELHPVNVLFNRVAIEFAIMYPQAAPIGDLKKALQQIVAKFASAAGRMILKDKKLIILCHD